MLPIPGTRRLLRADAFHGVLDLEGARLFERERSLDVVALLERLLQAEKHRMKRVGL